MDYCNGTTHFWSDDSYDCGSYPCPGPEQCSESALPPKKKAVVNPPKTKFHIVTQVVMTEYVPQSDEPPGRAPYAEHKTVLAENKRDVPSHQVSQRVHDVMTIA